MADDPQASTPPAVDASATPAALEATLTEPLPAEIPATTAEAIAAGAPVADASTDVNANFPDEAAIDELLRQAEFHAPPTENEVATAGHGGANAGSFNPATDAFNLPNFQQVMADAQVSSIDLLRDVDLNVKIELGRSRMLVEDVLKLGEGSVVELDKLAGDPVDVFVNDRLVARGEVLVLNENFCVRVNEIVAGLKDEGI